jgi:poly(3-hydroxybutyrate) depolymerase
VAAGLYDAETGGWLRPDPGVNGIFNLAFRYDEPIATTNTPPDVNQSIALAENEPTRYARDIDFAALKAGTARSTVPKTGRQIRIFPSRLQLGEGRDLSAFPQYRGPLQQYAAYIPTTYSAAKPAGLTLSMHSLGQQYWQYQSGQVFEQQGEQRGNVVLSPMGRGPDGWYQNEAEFDVFEAWNDLARHFALDATRVSASGYSMGGYGTYRLAGLYPDLFARAFTVVGPPGESIWLPPNAPTGGGETLSNRWLENFRNVPIMNLAAAEDELVPYVGPRAQNLGAPELGIRGLEQLGYDYRFLTFPAAEHFTLAALGYDFPMARDFLGDATVDRDPAHVTFGYVPASDDAKLGLVHDHAYWVSGVRVVDGRDQGTVDARSRAFGTADPEVRRVQGAGVAQLPYVSVGNEAAEPAPTPVENTLELSLTDIRSATIDLPRADLDTRKRPLRLLVSTTEAATLVLDGAFTGNTVVLRDGKPVPGVVVTKDRLTVPLSAGEGEYVVTRQRGAS